MELENGLGWRLFLILFFTLFNQCSYASSAYKVAPLPDWVELIETSDEFDYPIENIKSGIYYLLVDKQISVQKGRPDQYFHHFSDYLVNSTGVEQHSQINIDFDPIYQTLLLHDLAIIRDGIRIPKIDSALRKVIQTESDLEQLIYNGTQTLSIILDDVRVGDIIDYSYSIVGTNPVYDGYFSYFQSLAWSVPVGELFFRVIWNKDSELHSTLRNTDKELTKTKTEKGTEYTISLSNLTEYTIENDTPSWYSPWAGLYLSEFSNWEQISKWGQRLFADAYTQSTNIEDIAKSIKNNFAEKTDQAYEALKFVQNEIRYLGIELGLNSHIPSSAADTLARRYGDCKDKSALFITLLRLLDIEAHPVLVNTRLKSDLAKRPATAIAFNHVIVQVIIEEDIYYLDPTRTHQFGGLNNIYTGDQGFGLVLKEGSEELTELTGRTDASHIDVREQFILPANPSDPTIVNIKTRYSGADAEWQRKDFESAGARKIEQTFLEFFEKYYPGSQITSKLQSKDIPEQNKFELIESYSADNLWVERDNNSGVFDATFYGNVVNSYIPFQDSTNRRDPLYIPYPNNISQETVIQLPAADWHFDREQFNEVNKFFEFEFIADYEVEENLLNLKYSYHSKANVIHPYDYEEFYTKLEKISNYLSYSIYWDYGQQGVHHWYEELSGEQLFFLSYLALLVISVCLWRIDKRRFPDPSDSLYYPVAIPKFFAMWVITFGIYGCYWFYRNYKYIKSIDKTPSMPFARGIFSFVWYYPLWKILSKDSVDRFGNNLLPSKQIAIVLSILFFISNLLTEMELVGILSLFISVCLVLPMANYILHVNESTDASRHYSRWTYHHFSICILGVPILALTLSSEIGLTPSESVIKGNKLFEFDLEKFREKGIIKRNEKVLYFYSDGFLSNQEDGNGFTKESVFSFWYESNKQLNVETAKYSDISDIEVDWDDSFVGNTYVTIHRKDGSNFVLYVSNEDDKDEVFVSNLKNTWTKQR